jgi:tripartite-type tricarboxylate transporter receptor subunit TctC
LLYKLREIPVLSLRPFAGALCAAFLFASSAAWTDDWPTRPIRVISPFPAGSASDTTARVVLDSVSQFVGQPMVIGTKPGAGGIVGFADVAKADPDGYTFVTSSTSLGTGSVLHSHLP